LPFHDHSVGPVRARRLERVKDPAGLPPSICFIGRKRVPVDHPD
jgi:hypothetical protein